MIPRSNRTVRRNKKEDYNNPPFLSKASKGMAARYSFAHGGKDGHPYPVNKETYSQSIQVLQETASKARIGELDKMKALKRLSAFKR